MDIASIVIGVVTVIVILVLLSKPLPKAWFIIFGVVGIVIAVMGVTSAATGKFLGIASVVLGLIIAITGFSKAGSKRSSSRSSTKSSGTPKTPKKEITNNYSNSSSNSSSSSSYDDSDYDDDYDDDYDSSDYDDSDYEDDDDYGSYEDDSDPYPIGISSIVGVFNVYSGLASGTVYHDSDYVSDGTIFVSFKILNVTYNITLSEDEVRGLVEEAHEEICSRVQAEYPTYAVSTKCVDMRE